MVNLLYLKALHLIFVITWFAGLFYIVRLFIYYAEARGKESHVREILQKQYKLMIWRLWYIITWPSAVLASAFALWMLVQQPTYLLMPWMHLKLGFVALLFVYHGICHTFFLQTQRDRLVISSLKLRLWNEVATVLLFAIVFLAVLKNSVDWVYGVAGLLLLSIVLMLAVKWYKKIRGRR